MKELLCYDNKSELHSEAIAGKFDFINWTTWSQVMSIITYK